MLRLCLAFLPFLISGCIADIIAPPDDTTRNFACGVLSEARYDRFDIVLLEAGEPAVDLVPAVGLLSDRLQAASDRTIGSTFVSRAPLDEAATLEDLRDAYAEEGFTHRGRIVFRIALVPELEDWDEAGAVVRPGMIVLSSQAILNASATWSIEPETVAKWTLIHYAGHALGAVNAGIPMQENHEGPPRHEANRTSVMHLSWHYPSSRAAPEGQPDYSSAVVADWQGALIGVCA